MANDYKIYFAGLARDCEDTLEENIRTILDVCRQMPTQNCKVLIAENDSQDKTREILTKLEDEYNIELFLFDNLDEEYPIREKRIAHLRNILFEEIQDISRVEDPKIPKLYVPIDLDSEITQSIDIDQFLKECHRVVNGETDAVFPASEPYYYDIYALRAEGWVEEDCWNKVRESRMQIGSFMSKMKFVYSKQKNIKELKKEGKISVQSAFGGVGIYNLEKLGDASYKRDGDYPQNICEHTIFNKAVDSKEISTDFVVRAPQEHIRYNISRLEKFKLFLTSSLSDVKNLIVG
ncbi:hypothetical protein [Halorubrum ezzemoulense]|nr:hypothetical protein [Halorubrum ezzemoulense]